MKLKCEKHDRRVIVTERGTAVHRDANKGIDRCDSNSLVLGNFKVGGQFTLTKQLSGRRNRRMLSVVRLRSGQIVKGKGAK